jgi:hypothetical protein
MKVFKIGTDKPRVLTAIVVVLALTVALAFALFPEGVRAAPSALFNVFITDPVSPSQQARVDSSGNLQVTGSVQIVPEPFQFADDANFVAGSTTALVSVNVPVGKILVIEFLSAEARVPPGQRARFSVSVTGAGGGNGLGFVEATSQGTFSGEDIFVGSQQVRLYHGSAQPPVLMLATRDSTAGAGSATFSVGGYLIDAP